MGGDFHVPSARHLPGTIAIKAKGEDEMDSPIKLAVDITAIPDAFDFDMFQVREVFGCSFDLAGRPARVMEPDDGISAFVAPLSISDNQSESVHLIRFKSISTHISINNKTQPSLDVGMLCGHG